MSAKDSTDEFIWNQILHFYDSLKGRKRTRGILEVDEDGTHRCVVEADNGDGSTTKYSISIKPEINTHDDYWINYLKNVSGRRAIIDNDHYIIGQEPSESDRRRFGGSCYGMSGRKFEIHFLDTDETIVTHNLWHQGKIPEKHRGLYPNNAEFVTGGKVSTSEFSFAWNASL